MIERKVTRHTVSLLVALPGTEPEPMATAWHLPTGAKLYHRANGYFVSGVADGSDVREVLRMVGRKGRAVPMVGKAR